MPWRRRNGDRGHTGARIEAVASRGRYFLLAPWIPWRLVARRLILRPDQVTFESLAVIAYTLAALLPRFLVNAISALIVRPRAEDAQLTLVRYLTLSALAYGLGSPLIYWLLESPWAADHPEVAGPLWLVVGFIIPVLLGLLLGAATQRGWARSALRALGLKAVHVLPTAWD